MLSMLVLSACATPAPVTTEPVNVTVTDNSKNYGTQGIEPIYVRTFIDLEGEPKKEVTNVACVVTGDGFKASVVTPGLLNMPDRGNGSKAANITCTKGDETRSAAIQPYNKTSKRMMNAGEQGGLIGVIVMAGYDAARNKTNDDWGYQSVDVIFNR
jgi:hypothetical protein